MPATDRAAPVDRPARTLSVFAAGLALVFGAAYGVGRAFPDRTPAAPMEHDGTHDDTHDDTDPMETTP